MKEFKIEYQTTNHYEEGVSDAIFEILVRPCNDNTQVVTQSKQNCSLSSEFFDQKNFFGFHVQRLRTTKSFKTFKYNLSCKVQKVEPPVPLGKVSLKEQLEVLDSNDFYVDNHFFIQQSAFTKPGKKLEKVMLKYERQKDILEFLKDLGTHLQGLLDYEKDVTDVDTTAEEAIGLGKGVCQDYTHIFMSMVRFNKIPVRYASGYLFKEKDGILGADMMHSWAEVFIPFIGWVGFDPTNNRMVDENYIKVSHGMDYGDCSPLKGVIRTNGKNTTAYTVKIQSQSQ